MNDENKKDTEGFKVLSDSMSYLLDISGYNVGKRGV